MKNYLNNKKKHNNQAGLKKNQTDFLQQKNKITVIQIILVYKSRLEKDSEKFNEKNDTIEEIVKM